MRNPVTFVARSKAFGQPTFDPIRIESLEKWPYSKAVYSLPVARQQKVEAPVALAA